MYLDYMYFTIERDGKEIPYFGNGSFYNNCCRAYSACTIRLYGSATLCDIMTTKGAVVQRSSLYPQKSEEWLLNERDVLLKGIDRRGNNPIDPFWTELFIAVRHLRYHDSKYYSL